MDAVTVSNLHFRYTAAGSEIFHDQNLNIPQHSITVICGDNGTGKSTLLYLICGIIPRAIHGFLAGKILLNGVDYTNEMLPQLAPVVSILMQEIEWQLHFPSVEQEIVFGPENLGLSVDEIGQRLEEALTYFKIDHLRYLETHTLSCGQKKLVALASLYALRPSILVLDEPLNGLSEESRSIVTDFIRMYSDKHGTVILTAHQSEAVDLADKVVDLNEMRETL